MERINRTWKVRIFRFQEQKCKDCCPLIWNPSFDTVFFWWTLKRVLITWFPDHDHGALVHFWPHICVIFSLDFEAINSTIPIVSRNHCKKSNSLAVINYIFYTRVQKLWEGHLQRLINYLFLFCHWTSRNLTLDEEKNLLPLRSGIHELSGPGTELVRNFQIFVGPTGFDPWIPAFDINNIFNFFFNIIVYVRPSA